MKWLLRWALLEWFQFWHGIRFHYPVYVASWDDGLKAGWCKCGKTLGPL